MNKYTLLCLDDFGSTAPDSNDISSEKVPNKGEARPKSPGINN